MTSPLLAQLEQNIDTLIERCAELDIEIDALRAKETVWMQEREQLIQKNQEARTRVETMITHLKNLSNTEPTA